MSNKGYNNDFIERLKFNNDIVSTVSKYVTLQQKGKLHWGNCPFHSEKTPSFAVNGVEQYYHCFGCGVSGDVIGFIQKQESLDFMDAVKLLADWSGMEIPAYVGDENIKLKKEKKDQIINANKDAAIYYNKMLFTEKGKTALDYLFRRGLNKQVINKFGLGVSPDWTSLISYLKKLGYKEEFLKEAGLAEKSQKGHYYDIMSERLMFPIINSYGNVIGFSARALKDGKFAKYRNTAQTMVFDKSRIVYGINLLKKLKQTKGVEEIILVEGQMDVIALHSAGFENAVGSMGTALTKYHAKELKRFTNKVIISFDGDTAGQKATLRSLDILQDEDINVYVISLPEKLDPDEYIKKYGKEAYAGLLKNALPLNDYKIEAIASEFDLNNNREVTKFINKALDEVKKLKNSSEREIYLKIISNKTKVDIYTLQRDLEYKLKNAESSKNLKSTQVSSIKDANFQSAEFVLASIVHKKPMVSLPKQQAFENANHIKLYEFIANRQNLGKEIKVGDLFTNFNVDEQPEINDIINYDFNKINNIEKYYSECVKNLELDYLLKKQRQIISSFEKEDNSENKKSLMLKLQQITKEINNKKMEG